MSEAANPTDPESLLLQGVAILDPVLNPAGFRFALGDCGVGSGGPYASGSFQRGDLILELHVRRSLGLVTYHAGPDQISHRNLMRTLGHDSEAAYPGFVDDPLAGFRNLRSDLERFGEPFLRGDAEAVRLAARDAAVREAARWQADLARYEGDGRRREEARRLFRERDYAAAEGEFNRAKYPEQLTDTERRMWQISEDRRTARLDA